MTTNGTRAAAGPEPRIAMCLEQTLGHRAHGLNLRQAIAARRAAIDVFPIEYPGGSRLPVPWALRSSVAAYRTLRRAGPYDVTFFHTQTTALLAPQAVRGDPYVVSVDATPLQVDEMGRWYQHGRDPRPVEEGKRRWYASVFGHAAGIVTWSRWAAESLERDYGIVPSRLLVAHPGAARHYFDLDRRPHEGRPRILFVGGDFVRKGGPSLLRAFRSLASRADLELVTGERLPPQPGVTVLNDVKPGSPELLAAYARADVFCLPTLGDCTPVVLGEAMAAGLPVVTTDLASNPEFVVEGTGLLVPPADDAALRDALAALVDDVELRREMSRRARARAREVMDADRNAGRILDLLREVAA